MQSLYKVVAGFSMVNETQKRKIENEHYRINENNLENEFKVRHLKDKLIELDKLYWEFTINDLSNPKKQDYVIKIYSGKEQYKKQKQMYCVSYIDGRYEIFSDVSYFDSRGTDEASVHLYSSVDCVNIINKIIDDFNKINEDERRSLIDELPYSKEDKRRFTPLYFNDIGLDMMLALTSSIKLKGVENVLSISEMLEGLDGISKVTPCIDIGTEGGSYVSVLKDTGETVCLEIDRNDFTALNLVSEKCEFNGFKCTKDVEAFLLKGVIGDCCMVTASSSENNILKLKKELDLYNDENKCDYKDEFLNKKDKMYLHYYQVDFNEIVISMYDYDLSIMCDSDRGIYVVKKYISLNGCTERVYEVFNTRSVKELIKWISKIKISNYENIDYSVFLIG